MAEKYTNIKVTKKDNSEVEITGEISVEALSSYRTKAVKEVGAIANIPGFRKGHIPEKVLVDRFGEVYILEEAAELALKDVGPEIIEKNVPNYIGRPNISITKLAPGNPLEFKIIMAVTPEIDLPDYKKIAKGEMSKKEEVTEVTEKEINDVIEEVRKQRAHVEFHKAEAGDVRQGDAPTDHNHSDKELEEHIPELTDEFVKTVGDFKDVADFKTKIKGNLTKEKEHRAIEKKRGQLLEKLVAETKVAVPQVLVDSELNRMFAQFEQDISGLGLKVEDYLKHLKKTPEDLRKEWLPDAEKRAKLNLILEKIAETEKLQAEKKAVDQELEHLKKHHTDIDEVRAQAYIEHNLRMEQVILFLENQK